MRPLPTPISDSSADERSARRALQMMRSITWAARHHRHRGRAGARFPWWHRFRAVEWGSRGLTTFVSNKADIANRKRPVGSNDGRHFDDTRGEIRRDGKSLI